MLFSISLILIISNITLRIFKHFYAIQHTLGKNMSHSMMKG